VTPNFVVLGIDTPGFHWPKLCLPIFLLWVPVILLSPIILLAFVALAIANRTNIWRVVTIFWDILCSLPGTHVHVSAQDARVLVRIL
jgi:hypothetical protein